MFHFHLLSEQPKSNNEIGTRRKDEEINLDQGAGGINFTSPTFLRGRGLSDN
jgi:hypothetical protein